MRVLTALAGLAALVGLAGLGWIAWTGLLPASGGLLPVDLRPLGYDLAAATAYLEALSDLGRALIAGPWRSWSTVFALSFALFLLLVSLRGGGRPAIFGAAFALGYSAADLLETAAVLRMVAGPVPPDPLTVSGASVLTQVKFGLMALAVLTAFLARLRRGRGG